MPTSDRFRLFAACGRLIATLPTLAFSPATPASTASPKDDETVQLDLWRDRLGLTASRFKMSQENAFLKVIFPDGTFDFRPVPSSNTKGHESDLAAQSIDSVTVLFAYM